MNVKSPSFPTLDKYLLSFVHIPGHASVTLCT